MVFECSHGKEEMFWCLWILVFCSYLLYFFGIHPTYCSSHLPGSPNVSLWIECRCGEQNEGKNEAGFGLVYYLFFCFISNPYSSILEYSHFSCFKKLFLFYLPFYLTTSLSFFFWCLLWTLCLQLPNNSTEKQQKAQALFSLI